jgi:hypothetical protein
VTPRPLEQVLADWREDANALRRNSHAHDAQLIERLCDEVQASAHDFLNWLTEGEAKLRSGHSAEYLRARFPQWLEQGLARWDGKKRQYRSVCIPQRGNREAAREAGRRAGAA